MADNLPDDFASWDVGAQSPSPVVDSAQQSAPLPPPRPAALTPTPPTITNAPLPPRRPPEFGGVPKMPDDFAGWIDDQPVPKAPSPDLSIGDVAKQAAVKGLRQGILDAAHGAEIAANGFNPNQAIPEADTSPVGKLLSTPMDQGWKDPKWWTAQLAHGITAGAPTIGAGVVGSAAGSGVAGPAGALIGGAGGFAAGAALQELAPAYIKARQEGLTHDQAVDRAMKDTAIAGAFGAAMGAAPALRPFKSAISNSLMTLFGTMPSLMVGQHAAQNVAEGKPVGQGLGEAAVMGLAMGAPFAAMHAVMPRAAQGESPAGASDPIGDFIRTAQRTQGEADARAAGRRTKAEIDEFIRQKDARDAAERGLPAPVPPQPGNQGGMEGGIGAASGVSPEQPGPGGNVPRGGLQGSQPEAPASGGGAIPANEPAAPPLDPARAAENKALLEAGWPQDSIDLMGKAARASNLADIGYKPSEAPTAAPQQELAPDQGNVSHETPAAPGAPIPMPPPEPAAAPPDNAGTRAAPVKVEAPADIAPAREQVNPAPTPAQAEAGNYKKGHIEFDGLPISIENPKGSTRSGTDPDGKAWSVEMPGDYGYIKGTKGADKDHVDILIGGKGPTGKAFVVDQHDPGSGKFDELKVIAGVDNLAEAIDLYQRSFSDKSGASRIGAVTEVPISHLREMLADGHGKKSFADIFDARKRNARTVSDAGAHDLAADKAAMPEPQEQAVSLLRGEGNNDLSGVGERLSGVSQGRGKEAAQGADAGQDRQQQGIRAGERPLDGLGGSIDQSPQSAVGGAERREDNGRGSQSSSRVQEKSGELPSASGHDNRTGVDAGAHRTEARPSPKESGRDVSVDWKAEGRRAFENARQKMPPDGLNGDDLAAWQEGNRAAQDDATKKYIARMRRNAANRMPTSLVQFLRGMGGVQDVGGDLRSQDMGRRFIGLISRNGMSLDRAREAAAEAGYLGHDKERAVAETTVADLLDAIMDHPRYSAHDEDAVHDMKRKLADKKAERAIAFNKRRVETFMHEHGLSPDQDAVDRAAVILHEGEGWIDTEDAFERAVMQLAAETPETKAALDATTEDGFDAIPWDDWTGPVGPPPEEIAAGAAGSGDQAPRGGRQEADEQGEAGGDHGRPAEPARAPRNEADQAPRDEGQRGEPDQNAEVGPTVEPGAEGKPQTVIPGAEKISDKALAEKKADESLKPKVPQKGAGGMFDEAETAPQLFDAKPEPAKEPEAKKPGEPLGLNWRREIVREDEKGVRYVVENGVRIYEPVEARPTRGPNGAIKYEMVKGGGERFEPVFSLSADQAEPETPAASAVEALRDRFLDRNAEQFPTIVQARKFMLENGFKPVEGLPENKQIEEAIEHALVLAAREIVERGRNIDAGPALTFDKLAALYERQPRLGARTSTSVAEQAYSTPAPLAYVASRLAGIDASKTVLEPTAGNGMLLIEAATKKVVANELNDTRAAALREQGFGRVTQEDATRAGALPKGNDVVIANPPFGAVREGGASKVFDAQDFRTTNIDHAISLNALAAMKPDGRAVLIIGGVNSMDKAERQKGYQAQSKRKFFHTLLQNYKVADIFTVAGDLYERQGAGWPVDVIVIDGRGKTDRAPLTMEPPPVLKTWGEVKEKLNGAPSNDEPGEPQGGVPGIRGEETGTAVERPARPPRPAGSGGTDVGGGRPAESQPAAPPAESVVRKPDRQQSADDGSRKLGDEPQPAPRPVRDEPRVDRVPDPERGRPVAPNEAGQAPYRPASREAGSLGTLIPANLRDPAANALDAVQRIHGRVDDYVSKSLGYDRADLPRFFSAEQVDAIALALHNIEKGDGFILGDQTGIGKGRVVAAAIRYAHIKGLTPVFATEKPDLYGDMWRDLHDIGFHEYLGRPIEMFMTNAGTRIPLDEKAVEWVAASQAARDEGEKPPPQEGKFSKSQTTEEATRRMQELLAGTFKPDVVFTTYDQMNSVKGAETDRRQFLRAIAPRAFLIMDEAHNAGGQGVPEAGGRGVSKMKAAPRAQVFRNALSKANSVLYSSATYAKSPKVMDLFSRTDMAKAVENPALLPDLIARGGVPLQQIVSAMLGQSGQYLRRERSFDGVSYDLEVAPVDAGAYASFTEALGAIFRFDKFFSDERKALAEQIAQEHGAGNAMDSGTGEVGANSTEFSSIMHNAISQMVLSIKAKAAAERAVQALRDGEKPVIALSSTMEAFLTDFVESAGLKEGDPIDLDFGGVLRRYLERTRRITIKMPDDTKKHVMIPLRDMDPGTVRMYREAEKVLNNVEMFGLPISPIDAIRAEIQRAGFTVREITGRTTMIDYSGDQPVVASRASAEQGAAGKRVTIKMFNDGKLDAVILNKSGSTGVSMHAKDTYKDRRRRRMILVQADPNIDTHMQMLGRVHRTGQVIAPAYSQLMADIPAEARPTAVLMRKMASLNANTTASRKSKFSGEAVDFMNKYGDAVAHAVMAEDWQLNAALGGPVNLDGEGPKPNSMARVTGRLTLLPPDKQAELLDRLTNDYKALIARLDAEGKNDLEAKSIDLQARVLESQIIKPASGDGPFQAEVRLDKVSVKSQGKAMAPAEVLDAAMEAADFQKNEGMTFERDLSMVARVTKTQQAKMIEDVRKAALDHSAKEIAALKDDDAKDRTRKKNDAILARWINAARMAHPGNIVNVTFNGEDMPAVVIGFKKRKNVKNPVALGGWDLKLALPDSARTLEVPLSQARTASDAAAKGEGDDKLVISAASYMDTPATLAPLFENARKEGRENRFIFSGNILAAFDQTKGGGQIVNHTMEDGTTRAGILMSRKFSSKDFMESRAVRFANAAQVMRFLDQFPKGEITSTDSIVAVRMGRSAIEFDLPAARGTGGKYYTDATVRAIYDAWEKRGSRMRAEVARPKAQALLDAMMKIDAVFETRENQDAAQAIIDGDKPPVMAQAAPDGWGQIEASDVASYSEREQFQNDIEDIVNSVLPKGSVRVETPDRIEPMSNAVLERSGGGGHASRRAVAEFSTDGVRNLIRVAIEHPHPEEGAYHEPWHAVQKMGLATRKELAAMRAPATVRRLRALAAKKYGQSAADRMTQLELEANYIGQAAGAFYRGEAPPPLHSAAMPLVERFLRLIERIRNYLRGRGFTSMEDIAKRFYEGDFRGREATTENRLSTDELTEPARMAEVAPEGEPPDDRIAQPSRLSERVGARVAHLKDEGWKSFRENWVDVSSRVLDNMREIEALQEKPINPANDVYKAKRLYPGKVAAQQRDFDKEYVEPIVDLAHEAGLSRADVFDYLYAKHAPERNAWIREKTGGGDENSVPPIESGSGVSDERAAAVLARLHAEGKIDALRKVGALVQKMRHRILSILENGDVLSEDQAKEWRSDRMGRNWVPLRGFDSPLDALDHADGMQRGAWGGGRRLSVRGKESPEAFGRRTIADDPLATLVNLGFRAIERAEKNKVGLTAWRLFHSLPEDIRNDFVTFDKGKPEKVVDPETGTFIWRDSRPMADPERVLSLKIGGRPHHIVFADKALGQAMNRLDADTLPAIMRPLNSLVGLQKTIWTHMNPEFVIDHFMFRYPIEALVNSFEHGAGASLRSLRGHPFGPYARIIKRANDMTTAERAEVDNRVLAGNGSKEDRWQSYYHEMRRAGGLMDFNELNGLERTKKRIEMALARFETNPVRAAWGGAKALGHAVDAVTNILDNAQRLAAYIEAREKGDGPVDAALKAREATVDFAKRGRFSRYLNILLDPFSNTAIQSAARMMSAQGRSAKMRAAAAGVMSLGAAMMLYNYLYGGKDKDGTPWIEKVSDWTKRMKFVFMTPAKNDKGQPYYGKVAMPYNYGGLYTAGAGAMELALIRMGIAKEKPGEVVGRMLHGLLEATTPFAREENPVAKLMPSPFRPFLHVYANENTFGTPVHTQWPKAGEAKAVQGFENTPWIWKGIAMGANRMTGGDAYRSGFLDFFPEDYHEAFRDLTDTFFKPVERSVDAIGRKEAGLPVPVNDMFGVRRVVGGDNEYDMADRKKYFEDEHAASAAKSRLKAAMANHDYAEVQRIRTQDAADLQAGAVFSSIQRQRRALRVQRKAVRDNPKLTDADRRKQMDALRQQEIDLMRRGIEARSALSHGE